MKKDIHPNYELAIIRCACGSEVEIRTTQPGIAVEICSACHPFFTGKQKLMDAAGRVDRFRKRYNMEEAANTAAVIARADDARKSREAKTEARRKKAEEAASRAARTATPLKKPKISTAEAEAPKAEAPKAEAPKAEAPKAEAPKAEAPEAEAPKAEAPKAEVPKAEAPKAEAPKAEAPKAEVPKAEG